VGSNAASTANAIIPASPPVATSLSFAQLEGLWIQAGGPSNVAPLMAAIALAESGGRPTAENLTDNKGTQSSFGLWQISTGTHNPPNPNWSNPLTNAQLAVTKYNSQGLGAWGTYTSGAYKSRLPSGYKNIAPDTSGVVDANSAAYQTVAASSAVSCYWKIKVGVSVASTDICLDPILWSGLIALGAVALIAGAAFTVIAIGHESPTARKVVGTAAKLGKIGALVA
jgi:Lysozyme like domain